MLLPSLNLLKLCQARVTYDSEIDGPKLERSGLVNIGGLRDSVSGTGFVNKQLANKISRLVKSYKLANLRRKGKEIARNSDLRHLPANFEYFFFCFRSESIWELIMALCCKRELFTNQYASSSSVFSRISFIRLSDNFNAIIALS
jgi:hypothetical protein